ncbi:MAG TPA: histidine phosphatase family protein [Desulfobacteria bacterium]|nr:histidine phosphatase family protein [Desulfobacteria bacterium]
MERTNRIYLVRHGQVNGHEEVPICGHTDVDVTETGVLQLERMAERLRLTEPGAIYASDLKRAATGARQIGGYHNVPLHFLPELREMYFGEWEGYTLGQIIKDYPEEVEKRRKDPAHYACPGGGESISRLSLRIIPAFEKIRAEEAGKETIIVAHGGVNRVILSHALGLDLSRAFNIVQDYGCLNIIDYFPDSVGVKLLNG